jgi:hypothetical protein
MCRKDAPFLAKIVELPGTGVPLLVFVATRHPSILRSRYLLGKSIREFLKPFPLLDDALPFRWIGFCLARHKKVVSSDVCASSLDAADAALFVNVVYIQRRVGVGLHLQYVRKIEMSGLPRWLTLRVEEAERQTYRRKAASLRYWHVLL